MVPQRKKQVLRFCALFVWERNTIDSLHTSHNTHIVSRHNNISIEQQSVAYVYTTQQMLLQFILVRIHHRVCVCVCFVYSDLHKLIQLQHARSYVSECVSYVHKDNRQKVKENNNRRYDCRRINTTHEMETEVQNPVTHWRLIVLRVLYVTSSRHIFVSSL